MNNAHNNQQNKHLQSLIKQGIIYYNKHNAKKIEETLIGKALQRRDFAQIRLLLQYGADINPNIFLTDNLYTAYAIQQNDLEMLKFLVQNGADLYHPQYSSNNMKIENITRYLVSVKNQTLAISQFINNKNYNDLQNALSKCENIKNLELLHDELLFAINSKYNDAVKLLIENKANLYMQIGFYVTIVTPVKIQYIIDYGVERQIEALINVKYNNLKLDNMLEKYDIVGIKKLLKAKTSFVFAPDSCPRFIRFMYKYLESNGCKFTAKIDEKVLKIYKADYYQRNLMREILEESLFFGSNLLFKVWCLSNIGCKLPKPLLKFIVLDELLDKFEYLLTTVEVGVEVRI